MPRIKLLEDPAVASLVDKQVAKALATARADYIRLIRSVTAEALEGAKDGFTVKTLKLHVKAIVDALKNAETA